MSNSVKLAWNEDTTAALRAKAESFGGDVITQEQVATIAAELSAEFSDEKAVREASARSVGAKLRKEGFTVQRADEVVRQTWSEEDEAELRSFLNANDGEKTYAEIAAAVAQGKYTSKQVQGKVLSMEMSKMVKPTVKSAPARKFSPQEEAEIISLVNGGEYLEVIAERLERSTRQIHGKCLSLLKEERINALPEQRDHKKTARADILDGLDVANMTVQEIAEATGRNTKGIKSTLTRRGLDCKDHKGSTRRAKLDEKAAEKAE